MSSPLKILPTILSTVIPLVLAISQVQAQERGIHGPRWGFAVASAASKDLRHPRLSRTWNPTHNLDSVWIVMGRSHTAPIDSMRLSIRSGPARLISGMDPSQAYVSDSLGEWVEVPASLLRPGHGERNIPMPMRVLGSFSPGTVASWARSQNPTRPVVTRVAVAVWRHKRFERSELYLESPIVDAKPKPVAQPPAPTSSKSVRK